MLYSEKNEPTYSLNNVKSLEKCTEKGTFILGTPDNANIQSERSHLFVIQRMQSKKSLPCKYQYLQC